MPNASKLAVLALVLGAASAGVAARLRDIAGHSEAPRVADRVMLEEVTVEACLVCHKGPLSLASWESDALLPRIVSLAANQHSHPVPIPSLSDEDFASLAGRLAQD